MLDLVAANTPRVANTWVTWKVDTRVEHVDTCSLQACHPLQQNIKEDSGKTGQMIRILNLNWTLPWNKIAELETPLWCMLDPYWDAQKLPE